MSFKTSMSAALLATGLAFATAPATLAQTQPDGAELAADSAKLESFVMAALEVSALRNDYIAQLQALQDDAAQQSLLEEANAAILQVVEQTPGITVEEYVAIGEAATNDPELASALQSRMRERAAAE
ncbi:DUF4168 domain-containing protein [Roseibaca sp. Y0-43]|uniref:DUF4168 domain-containing protein n=1 Tax=Roseibaca sp. Y0-43 TaxID=2816854 RepID=UPI001D0C1C2D|nr:DUF4168 domain-containing protein [Roseibaca sp. Y0-43]MCC1480318.1 DUF4168 domain-containing protein [Roseibaca sp. Y0-43]